MSTNTLAYYLLGILALVVVGFSVGTLIAGRLSRNREAAQQTWDEPVAEAPWPATDEPAAPPPPPPAAKTATEPTPS